MPDNNQDIAHQLKTQRQNAGLSIEQIFERTRINPDFLNALETGDFDILPTAYVRLFLKTYAKEVGLDPDEILAQYEKTAAPLNPEPPPAPPEHRQTSMVPIIMIACAFVIVIIIAMNLQEQTEEAAPLDASATAQPVAPQPTQKTPSKPETSPTPEETPSAQIASQDSTNTPAIQPDTLSSPTAQPELVQPTITTAPSSNNPPIQEPSATTPTTTAEPTETDQPTSSSEIATTPTNREEITSTPTNSESTTTPAPPTTTPTDSIDAPPANLTPAPASTPASPEPEVLTTYALPMPVLLTDEEVMTLSGFVRETTHVAISADGREVFDGVLQAGSQQRWQARDRFQLQVQRAGAIALSLQDQPLESASPPDRTLRLSVSRTLIRVEELGESPSDR